jgi:electron transfer flavoprotein beta subunit
VIAVVLVHQGLDVSVDFELGAPGGPSDPTPTGPGGERVRHRGGDRLLVTPRADRAALEWALALADRVIAVTVGSPASGGVLDWALGRGATAAARVWDPALGELDLAAMARVVSAAIRRAAPDLVLAGERGLAGATAALPALLAAHLEWPLVDAAIRLGREDGELVVERRLSGGRREELALACPAVVTVTADSAEPRYVSVQARRGAARRGHATWSLEDLQLTSAAVRGWVRLHVGQVDWPRPRPRRTAAAPPARSAAERLRQLVGGGAGRTSAAAAPESRVGAGDARAVADRILTFLEQNGFA